jgi:hypothetical protein
LALLKWLLQSRWRSCFTADKCALLFSMGVRYRYIACVCSKLTVNVSLCKLGRVAVNVVCALQEIGKSYAGKTVLVVTHGEVRDGSQHCMLLQLRATALLA